MKQGQKVSLNLGGGGARGLAHLGVLRALNEIGVGFDFIVGVSMGALVGSIYAAYGDIDTAEKHLIDHIHGEDFQESLLGTWKADSDYSGDRRNILLKLNRIYKQTGLISRLLLAPGVLSDEDIQKAVVPAIPDVTFADLEIPFACVAVDIETGEARIFKKGPIRQAVLASLSMPLVFPPVEIEGDLYVDGGVIDRVGVDSAESLGATKIIAVDVSNDYIEKRKIKTGIDVMIRSEEIGAKYRKRYQLNRASVVLSPIKDAIHWADYTQYQQLIDSGYKEVYTQKKALLGLGEEKGFLSRFFRPGD